MKNCIICLPSVGYIKHWASVYRDELSALGYAVKEIEVHDTSKTSAESLCQAVDEDTAFILSIYAVGSDLRYKDQNLYDYLKIPFLAVCIDHLEYYSLKVRTNSAYTFWGLFDAADYDYGIKYISADKKFFFLPNAGFQANYTAAKFDDRHYDVTFIGTIPEYEDMQEHWLAYKSDFITETCQNTVEVLLADESKMVVEAFEEVMLANGIIPHKTSWEGLDNIFAAISHYVRGLRRELMLKQLAGNGIKIHCFGPKNQLARFQHPNLITHDFLQFDKYLNVLGNSKISINSLPMSRQASSERLVSGMLNGAAIATDSNPYIKSFYTDNESAIFYEHANYDLLADRIAGLLNRPQMLAEIAANGQNITFENHRVAHRVKTLISVAEFSKLSNG